MTRWRGSLAELMLKVDRAGNIREFIDPSSEGEGGPTARQPPEVSFLPSRMGLDFYVRGMPSFLTTLEDITY